MICQLAIFQQLTNPAENFFSAFSTDTPSAFRNPELSRPRAAFVCRQLPPQTFRSLRSLHPSHFVGPSRSLPRAARFAGGTACRISAAGGTVSWGNLPARLRCRRPGGSRAMALWRAERKLVFRATARKIIFVRPRGKGKTGMPIFLLSL